MITVFTYSAYLSGGQEVSTTFYSKINSTKRKDFSVAFIWKVIP